MKYFSALRYFTSRPLSSVSGKLNALVFSVITAVFIVGVSSVIFAHIYYLKKDFESRINIEATIIADSLKASVAFEDAQSANTALSSLRVNRDLVKADVFTANNRALASVVGNSQPSNSTVWLRYFDDCIVSKSIIVSQQTLGSVKIASSFRSRLQTMIPYWMMIIVATLLSAFFTMLSLKKGTSLVTGPLEKLHTNVQQVITSGDYSIRMPEDASDEIGVLASAFNSLLNEVGVRDEALRTELAFTRDQEQRLQHLAYIDQLTGLPNRAKFDIVISQHLLASHADKDVSHGCLLFIDLDDFKKLNDEYGHSFGDNILRVLSKRLSTCCDMFGGTATRLGGDEFAAHFPGVDSADKAKKAAQLLLENLSSPIEPADKETNFALPTVSVKSSIGVRLISNIEYSIDEYLAHADAAMYQAKSSGKGRVVIFNENTVSLSDDSQSLRSSSKRLKQAISSAQITAAYQPIVDARTGEHLHYEALARWHGGPSPTEFIPLAEHSGLIGELGRLMLAHVLRDIKAWDAQGLVPRAFALNVSAHQLISDKFVDHLIDQLQLQGIARGRLIIEITESSFLTDKAHTLSLLNKLLVVGVSIAIDDFGTGYSALSYLKDYPVHILKIDRSLVKDLNELSLNRKIVKAIIDMAEALEVEVIAEGVETEEQKQALLELGCWRMQGWLFAKADSFNNWTNKAEKKQVARARLIAV